MKKYHFSLDEIYCKATESAFTDELYLKIKIDGATIHQEPQKNMKKDSNWNNAFDCNYDNKLEIEFWERDWGRNHTVDPDDLLGSLIVMPNVQKSKVTTLKGKGAEYRLTYSVVESNSAAGGNRVITSMVLRCDDPDDAGGDEIRMDILLDGNLYDVVHCPKTMKAQMTWSLVKTSDEYLYFGSRAQFFLYEDDGTAAIPNWSAIGETTIDNLSIGKNLTKILKAKWSKYTLEYTVQATNEQVSLDAQIERAINAFDKDKVTAWKAKSLSNEDGQLTEKLRTLINNRNGLDKGPQQSYINTFLMTYYYNGYIFNQRNLGMCAAAAFCYEWVRVYPLMFIKKFHSLYRNGYFTVLKKYSASKNLREQPTVRLTVKKKDTDQYLYGFESYPISWIVLTALADATNTFKWDWSAAVKEPDFEERLCRKWDRDIVSFHGPEAIKEWSKYILLYEDVHYKDVTPTTARDKLASLCKSIKDQKSSIFLQIDSRLLNGGSDGISELSVFRLISYSHWVTLLNKGYQDWNASQKGLEFNVYSWEKRYQVKATKKILGNLFVSYISCQKRLY